MDGYIIRKGERVDWFTHEDGSLADCVAGVDIWVEWSKVGRHIRPLQPLSRDETLVVMRHDETRGKAVSGHGTQLSGTPALTVEPFTYTPAPFSPTIQAGEEVRISPEQLDAWVQETYGRPTPTAQE